MFVNKMGLPEEQFLNLKKNDAAMLQKLIATLMSLGVRKHNRIPIILSYEVNDSDTGSYKSSDDYFIVYRNPNWPVQELVGTVSHEIGHAIYQRLDQTEKDQIRNDSGQIPSFTRYTDPKFVSYGRQTPTEDHESGNEWFADYVAATVMQGFGLAPDTKVGSWEPVNDPKQGIRATKKVLGSQNPTRTRSKEAAGFLLKNRFIWPQVTNLANKLSGNITLGDLNLPHDIVSWLGGDQVSAKEIIDEFQSIANNRLESLTRDNIRIFLTTLRSYVDSRQGAIYGAPQGQLVSV